MLTCLIRMPPVSRGRHVIEPDQLPFLYTTKIASASQYRSSLPDVDGMHDDWSL